MEFLAFIEGSWPAEELRGSAMLYMVVNAAHILGIALLIGAILPLDLALVGVLRGAPVAAIGPFLSRASAVGLGLALVTGFLLWSVRPADYLANPVFLWKLGLLALALVNVGLQHALPGWRRAIRGEEISAPTRFFAALSALSWPAVLLAGRWIAFA